MPAACGRPGVVAQFPQAVRVGVAFADPVAGASVQEAVSGHPDRAGARTAFDASIAGLDCGQGSVAGRPVVVLPPEDLRADVGATGLPDPLAVSHAGVQRLVGRRLPCGRDGRTVAAARGSRQRPRRRRPAAA